MHDLASLNFHLGPDSFDRDSVRDVPDKITPGFGKISLYFQQIVIARGGMSRMYEPPKIVENHSEIYGLLSIRGWSCKKTHFPVRLGSLHMRRSKPVSWSLLRIQFMTGVLAVSPTGRLRCGRVSYAFLEMA